MFYINVVLTAKNEADVPEMKKLFVELAARSRKEPGCERYEVYHSENHPKVFILVERWTTEALWQEHRKAAAAKEIYEPLIIPRVDRTPYHCELVSG